MLKPYTCDPLGDSAIVITFGEPIHAEINKQVHQATQLLLDPPVPGLIEMVPAFSSLTVYYECSAFDSESPYQVMLNAITERLKALQDAKEGINHGKGRLIEIPVCYEPPFAPDIQRVAQHCGLSIESVVEIHCSGKYQVFFIGFVPGFPYLGGMSPALSTPRKTNPDLVIPAGAVGIAGGQTGIYPIATPGGWQIIGRTPVSLVDFKRNPPTLLQAGDRLRFKPISVDEFAGLRGDNDA